MTHKPTIKSTALSVNLNKIALIRNSREGNYPSVVQHAEMSLEAGADGITVHPRPDQRHIRPSDVFELADMLKTRNEEFNIEGNPWAESQGSYPGFMALVDQARPEQCTLVPDGDDQLTSDHGFDLTQQAQLLAPVIQKLKDWGCRVSLFMDPNPEQMIVARDIGADRIELYTGPYALAMHDSRDSAEAFLEQHIATAEAAQQLGIGVNAGHDLNLDNLLNFRRVPNLLEVSIGHALTVDALSMGFAEAVRRYKAICSE